MRGFRELRVEAVIPSSRKAEITYLMNETSACLCRMVAFHSDHWLFGEYLGAHASTESAGQTGRGVQFYMALGLVTAATLMLQIIETRIISVISWYHLPSSSSVSPCSA